MFNLEGSDYKWIINGGYFGVQTFFVLSGFLITSIIVKEKTEKFTVDIKRFYLKRVLRIWPLYYLVLFCSILLYFIIYSNSASSGSGVLWMLNYESIGASLLLLPNFSYVFYNGIPFFTHAWSIGVEEQFYVVWPWLFKKKMNWFVVVSMALVIFSAYDLFNSFGNSIFPYLWSHLSFKRWHSFNIEPMLWGAWVFLASQKVRCLMVFLSLKPTSIIMLFLISIIFFSGYWFPVFHFQLTSLILAILISSLAFSGKSYRFFENKIIKYLGNISYGFYMFHPLILFCLFHFLRIRNSILIYGIGLGLTIIISSLSYEKFEKYFLSYKK